MRLVTMVTPGLCTPRVVMHWWVAFGDHGDAVRFKHLVEAGRDLGGHLLLNLQPPRIDFDQPRQFGNADDAVARQIADMHASDDRRQMVLAKRLEADVAQHDDFVVAAGLLEGALEIFARIVVIAGEPFLIGAGDARRRGQQAFAVRIVAGPADERAHRGLGLGPRRLGGLADAGRFAGCG